jgi:hypothetical protein
MSISPSKAKQFIVDRILDQARLDGVSLSDVEVQMLGFVAQTTNAEDLKGEERFRLEVDEDRYEKNIAELIRRAYQRDKDGDALQIWEQPLDSLAEKDIYLNVMIQRAGISGTSGIANLFDWRLLIGLAPALIFVAFGFFIAFSPIGGRLIPNDLLRLLVLVVCLATPFAVYRIGRKTRP